jgi:hypothetical protein
MDLFATDAQAPSTFRANHMASRHHLLRSASAGSATGLQTRTLDQDARRCFIAG